MPVSFTLRPMYDDNLCEPDRNVLDCNRVSDAFGLGGLACTPRRLIGSWGSVRQCSMSHTVWTDVQMDGQAQQADTS